MASQIKNLCLSIILLAVVILLGSGCDSVFGPDCQELFDKKEAAWDRYVDNPSHATRKAWSDASDQYYKHCN